MDGNANTWHRQPVTLSGLDHSTDIDGECFEDCAKCEIDRLRKENKELREIIAEIIGSACKDVFDAKFATR